MALIWPAKNPSPDEVDFAVDWTEHLGGDTIATSAFSLTTAAGLTKNSESNTSTSAIVWLAGGTAGQTALLRNTITTNGGRTYYEDIILPISSGLVIETGAGLANAESWATVLDADEYCAAHGLAWVAELEQKEQALRRAAKHLTHSVHWKGWRTKYRAQALAWPRAGACDAEDNPILIDEIPYEVIHAQIELAVYELANPGGLTPTVVLADKVKSEQVGPIRVDYAVTAPTADQSRPVLTRVDDLIAGLIDGGGGSGLSGEANRA